MNLDDARTVLEWLGYEPQKGQWWRNHATEDLVRLADNGPIRIDANWIHGTLIPALEKRLGLNAFGVGPGYNVTLHDKAAKPIGVASGPTFEAALVSAAAKAIRGQG